MSKEYPPSVHEFAEKFTISLEEADSRLAGAAKQDPLSEEQLAVRAYAKQHNLSLAAATRELEKQD